MTELIDPSLPLSSDQVCSGKRVDHHGCHGQPALSGRASTHTGSAVFLVPWLASQQLHQAQSPLGTLIGGELS